MSANTWSQREANCHIARPPELKPCLIFWQVQIRTPVQGIRFFTYNCFRLERNTCCGKALSKYIWSTAPKVLRMIK